jgi:putative RecB family exonuclease
MDKIYSYSKISTFENCPYKFKLKYIDKISPEIVGTIEAHLGKAVHSSLEWLYNLVIKKEIPKLDELLIHYKEIWQKEYNSNIVIINKNLKEEDYFNKGIIFLINYYNSNLPFNDGTIECEKKIFLNLDKEKNYKLIGYIDRFSYNSEKKEYEIHDYKTANSLPTKEKIETDKQLPLYSIAIKEILTKVEREKEISLNWHYLAYSKKISIKRNNEQLEKIKKEVIEKINEIESTKYFPRKPSKLCDWCEYKNICKNSKISDRISQEKIEENYHKKNVNKTLDIY